ncbi:MAG TPA: hypothetical protein DEB31_03495 [Clostridiales bacterium]|nr:hypothetical protein [Clostridiales bacterium]
MNFNLPLTEPMHIHSLNGELREATILEKLGDNDYMAEFDGVKCHAIFNPFVNHFYVDDTYAVIEERQAPQMDDDLER